MDRKTCERYRYYQDAKEILQEELNLVDPENQELQEERREQLRYAEEQMKQIRQFGESLTDPLTRQVFRLRVIDGCTWSQIGRRCRQNADYLRLCVYRKIFSNR